MLNTQTKTQTIDFELEPVIKALTYLNQTSQGGFQACARALNLEASNGQMRLWSTDRILCGSVSVPCTGELPTITLPLVETLKQLKSAKISKTQTASFDGEFFTTGSMLLQVNPLETTSKEVPRLDEGITWHFPNAPMKEKIKQALTIVCEDSPRNYGSVAYFDEDRIVATDGFRLAYTTLEGNPLRGICIGYRGLKALTRLPGNTQKWTLSDDRVTLQVTTGAYTILIRLSAVRYPNYKGVIPAVTKEIDVEICLGALKSLLASTDKSNAILIESCANDRLKLSTKRASFTVKCGERWEFPRTAINGRFLLDTLKDTKEDSFLLGFNDTKEAPIQIGLPTHQTIIVPIKENK